MVTATRDSNGKFIKQSGQPDAGVKAIDTASVREDSSVGNGSAQPNIDPAKIDGERDSGRNQSAEQKRGRGRPAGSGKKQKEKGETLAVGESAKVDLNSLNFTLFFAHELLAKATKCPELSLDKDESEQMATAAINVMNHYNIKTSQKAVDWGNLLLTCGLIYGSRFHKINERHKQERADKRAANQSSAFGMPGNG